MLQNEKKSNDSESFFEAYLNKNLKVYVRIDKKI